MSDGRIAALLFGASVLLGWVIDAGSRTAYGQHVEDARRSELARKVWPRGWENPRACGLNSAYALLKIRGYRPDYQALRATADLGEHGLSLAQVCALLANNGVAAEVSRFSWSEVRQLPPLFIVHREAVDQGGGGHYDLVVSYGSDRLTYFHGSLATVVGEEWDDFLKTFSGHVILPGAESVWDWGGWRAACAASGAALGVLIGLRMTWRSSRSRSWRVPA